MRVGWLPDGNRSVLVVSDVTFLFLFNRPSRVCRLDCVPKD